MKVYNGIKDDESYCIVGACTACGIIINFGMKIHNDKTKKLFVIGHGQSHFCCGTMVFKMIELEFLLIALKPPFFHSSSNLV